MKTSYWEAKHNGLFMLLNPALIRTNDFIADFCNFENFRTKTKIIIQELELGLYKNYNYFRKIY